MVSYDIRPRRKQLKHVKTLLLAVIENKGPLHGYGIARELERTTSGYFMLKESTLYPALNELELDGSLTSEWVNGGRNTPRRCYSITKSGCEELAERRAEWKRFSAAVNSVLSFEQLPQKNGQAEKSSLPVDGHPSDETRQVIH